MAGRGRRNGGGDRRRAYPRLDRQERNTIERLLDQGRSAREIAREIGRAPSTVTNEVAAHRYVSAPKAMSGAKAPADDELALACPRLGSWPRCCNGCPRRRAYGCSRKPRVFYEARRAQAESEAVRSDARRGIDATEWQAARALAAIRDGLARGLSPEQICLASPDVKVSPSTVYRWVREGYAGMSNMDLRRKVGYRPRSHRAPTGPSRHSAARSHDRFLALGDDCDGAWEMDTVMGRASDSACVLTLLHRPSRLQLVMPLASCSPAEVKRALGSLRGALGPEGVRRAFAFVLTDNGPEFSDEAAIAAALGERPGEVRLFYCDARRSDQKGACERNHVEVRKLLPKGRGGVSLEGIGAADCAVVMSQVNSQPRPVLGGLTPIAAFRAMLGDDAGTLLDALGVEELAYEELMLSPEAVNRARAERGEAPLA